MEDTKLISYILSQEELISVLKTQIKSEHASLIAETIISHLDLTDLGLSQLMGAIVGLKKNTEYKLLDEVYIPIERLARWRINKENMKKENMMHKDLILCKIVAIDLRKHENIRVQYEFIRDNGEKEIESEFATKIEYIVSKIDNDLIE